MLLLLAGKSNQNRRAPASLDAATCQNAQQPAELPLVGLALYKFYRNSLDKSSALMLIRLTCLLRLARMPGPKNQQRLQVG